MGTIVDLEIAQRIRDARRALDTDPRRQAILAALEALLEFRPATIYQPVNSDDGEMLAADLRQIARIVDTIFLSYGEYARSQLGLSQKAIAEHCAQATYQAIDGNATFDLERAAENYREDFL